MAYLTMKQLLESGVHFGHQTKRWNPKMKSYIFGARNGIYIIDLQQTVKLFNSAYDYIKDIAARGGRVLFIGTKKQAHNSIAEEAARCGMEYVNSRWIGGFLTNFQTVKKSIDRLNELDKLKENQESSDIIVTTKKEALMLERERERLEKYLGGVRTLDRVPNVVFVIDSKREAIAIREARKLGIPVVAIVDTNCDPDEVDYVIPGNDDAIRAIKLFSVAVADAVLEGRAIYEESLQAASDKGEAVKAPEAAESPEVVSEAEAEEEKAETTPEATEAGSEPAPESGAVEPSTEKA